MENDRWDGTDYHYTPPNHEQLDQVLDSATLGLFVHGVRALLNPQLYSPNPFTDNARAVVEAQFGVDGGYEIPAEILEIAFPPKNNLLR